MDATELKDASRAKLITDVKAVVADAEAYLSASVGQTGEAYAKARTKLQRTLDATKEQIAETHRVLSEKTRATAHAADTYVRARPWESVAVGAGLGLVVGLLLSRR